MSDRSGRLLRVRGVVQGVGFRPFVYGLATDLGLAGWVRNTSAGVEIAVEGFPATVEAFRKGLQEQAPPLARIDAIEDEPRDPDGYSAFEILASVDRPESYQPVSPDVAVCPDCLRELFDPHDRRYRYPFINCTNCGPRFTIIADIPYDRPNTTMAGFGLCPACAAEYEDPRDRRFHAQPVACPACGPRLWLEAGGERIAQDEDALQTARRLLRQGKVVAIKGLGGFHLACDATSPGAVGELRRRKLRVDKPFGLMLPDLATVEAYCHVGPDERQLLESRERPIVLLERRSGSSIVESVAPGQHHLGIMLPYTPLHYLLLEPDSGFPPALVMTSGNMSEEPIATENDDARARLAGLADAFLMHDRDIRTRCDDSVLRVFGGQTYPLRRSRGYAPFPVRLPRSVPTILAVGGELKNAFCVARDAYAFLSHHIGDMHNYETYRSFEDGVTHFERLFRVRPAALAYDRHPDYMATRYALQRSQDEGLAAVGVQHHHAHIAACMLDNDHPGDRPVIGIAFDGTGYGDDGLIWGGEFLVADYAGYRRAAHLSAIPMPGGEAAVREPWRLALAWLERAGMAWEADLPPFKGSSAEARRIVRSMIGEHARDPKLNAPLTTSMGRLFDAVSALCGVRQEVNYEAQAAVELEAGLDRQANGAYKFAVDGAEIDPSPVIREVVDDVRHGVAASAIAARFHRGVVEMVLRVCADIHRQTGLNEVALSGGVWQNMTLLEWAVEGLRGAGFTVLLHRQVPANDGGLALGQVAVAAEQLEGRPISELTR
jgi:hydrogenase maturation protein HypF